MMLVQTPFLALCVVVSCVTGGTSRGSLGPADDLHVVNHDIGPDGFIRPSVLVNGVFPGPLITGFKGEHFLLNVSVELTDSAMLRSTSIHWHGFFQHASAWNDGPVGISQCPITPSHSYLYDFKVTNQAGTFWYHSHLSTQYCDGLRGPFVVYDPDDPHLSEYEIDDENTVITLADWYHTPAPSAGAVPTPASTLINGRGRYDGGPRTELAVINVVRGKRYRFRLVAISCSPNYAFAIQDHDLTIIEADGINTAPLTVTSIQIYAGQRYSFVLSARRPIGNYWIRANPNLGSTGFEGGLNSAILRYRGAREEEPVEDGGSRDGVGDKPLVETDLHPLVSRNLGDVGLGSAAKEIVGLATGLEIPEPDVKINLAIAFNGEMGRFTVNGATFVVPTAPVLLQILSGARTAQELLPKGSVYLLPPGKLIEVSIPGGSPGSPHPLHLHGHSFDVVRSAGSSSYNFVDPVQRDVVSTGFAGDNVTIRFRTDNPGPWIFHCHIDWHLEIGLAIVFAEDVDNVLIEDQPPDTWEELCPLYDAFIATEEKPRDL